jgi:type I restriction enzyme S subunit
VTAGWHKEGPIRGPGFVVGRATNLGVPTWSEGDYWPLNTTLYASDFKGNDPKFLFHLFETLDLSGYDSGSVQPMLNRNYIASIEVQVPNLKTQRAIAEVLGAFDDKIAANNRAISAAETCMAARVEESSSETTVAAIARQSTDASPPEYFEASVAHFSLPAFDAGQSPEVCLREAVKSNKFLLREPVVLISKLNPRIPRIWNVSALPGRMSVASTEFVVLRPLEVSTSELWAAISQPSVTIELANKVSGTSGSHQRVKPAEVLGLVIPDPRSLSAAVRAEITSLGAVVHARRLESQRLAATRDELLPLLMSGKVRVRDAERVVGDLV